MTNILQYIGGAAVTGTITLIVLFCNRHWQQKDKSDAKADEALDKLRQKHNEDMEAVNTELTVICYGVLAALKGLAENGCDGPVHDAIDHLEKHLNKRAHE